MQKSQGSLINTIKDVLEKGVGLKNLTSVEITPQALRFSIHTMQFIVVYQDMSVSRVREVGAILEAYQDDSSRILQRGLRVAFEENHGGTK